MGAPKKRVAVIGAGPAGLITIDALAQEKAFDVIRVFERREGPGGCWIAESENNPPPVLRDLEALASRDPARADPPTTDLPASLPARTAPSSRPRFSESSVYPYLETNVDDGAMAFTQEPIPRVVSAWSRGHHGPDSPFRHWTVIRDYLAALAARRGYPALVAYRTTVERAERVVDGGGGWRLTLRREDGEDGDCWWSETFDALVVASGHYSVPYIPSIPGLEEWARRRPGSIIHSKHYRGRDAFKGKHVVVVGASVSAADIAVDLTQTAQTPVHAVVVGHALNGYFGGAAFEHPRIAPRPSIARVDAASGAVHFVDGTAATGVDALVFGTGFTWTLPFLAGLGGGSGGAGGGILRNNRPAGLYQHVVYRDDPSLLFVGAVGAGLTFKIFEWQAVLAARVLAGRARLPPREEQERWERERIAAKGDGAAFTVVFPDFEEYFEDVRRLAGPPTADGRGRELPPFDQAWYDKFMAGHELRKAMWKRINAQAREELSGVQGLESKVRSNL